MQGGNTDSRSYENLNRERAERVFGGRYEIISKLGSGGMGDVFLVQANDLSRKHYALKIISKSSPENMGVNVYAEIMILQKLRHPNIVTIFEALEDSYNVYMIQEYIDGVNLGQLRDRMPADDSGNRAAILMWMTDVADALAYLHSNNIIHRDIKPGNIMIDSDGNARLIDFGLARRVSSISSKPSGSTFGSAPYSPLERLEGEPDSEKTDIYAFGTTFYSVLFRKVPHIKGADINTLRTDNKSIRPYYMNAYRMMNNDIDTIEQDGLRELLKKCIQADPKRRPDSFNTIRYWLRGLDTFEQVQAETKKIDKAKSNMLKVILAAGIFLTALGMVQMFRDHNAGYDRLIREAESLYQTGAYTESQEVAYEAIEYAPRKVDGYISKYRAETAIGFEQGNPKMYDQLIAEFALDAERAGGLNDSIYALTYLADAYFETENYSKVIDLFGGRSDLQDEQLVLLGQAYLKSGDRAQAEDALSRIVEDGPQKYYLEGLIAQEKDTGAAILDYERVLSAEGRAPDKDDLKRKALSQIAGIYIEEKEYTKAVSVIDKWFGDVPFLEESVRLNLMKLNALYLNGDYEQAAAQAGTILSKKPMADIYAIRTSSYEQLGEYDSALETIAEWEGVFPNDAEPHVRRALIYNNIAGLASSDAERWSALPDFINVYEEERAWLEEHGVSSAEFDSLRSPYESAVAILGQMESGR